MNEQFRTQPSPDHYWDLQTMSWQLRGDCSELSATSGSTTTTATEFTRGWNEAVTACIVKGSSDPAIKAALRELYQ